MISTAGGEKVLPAISAREEAFVDAYVGSDKFDAVAAARSAGYRQPAAEGPVLFRKESIFAHITARLGNDPKLQAAFHKHVETQLHERRVTHPAAIGA